MGHWVGVRGWPRPATLVAGGQEQSSGRSCPRSKWGGSGGVASDLWVGSQRGHPHNVRGGAGYGVSGRQHVKDRAAPRGAGQVRGVTQDRRTGHDATKVSAGQSWGSCAGDGGAFEGLMGACRWRPATSHPPGWLLPQTEKHKRGPGRGGAAAPLLGRVLWGMNTGFPCHPASCPGSAPRERGAGSTQCPRTGGAGGTTECQSALRGSEL